MPNSKHIIHWIRAIRFNFLLWVNFSCFLCSHRTICLIWALSCPRWSLNLLLFPQNPCRSDHFLIHGSLYHVLFPQNHLPIWSLSCPLIPVSRIVPTEPPADLSTFLSIVIPVSCIVLLCLLYWCCWRCAWLPWRLAACRGQCSGQCSGGQCCCKCCGQSCIGNGLCGPLKAKCCQRLCRGCTGYMPWEKQPGEKRKMQWALLSGLFIKINK